MNMVDWRGKTIESKYQEQELLPEEAANLGSKLAGVEKMSDLEMINDSNKSSSVFTIQAASLIHEGLVEKTPISWEEQQMNAKCFAVSKDSDWMSLLADPIMNQSVFVSRIAEMAVHHELVDRLGKVLGEGAFYSEDSGLGFFIDFDDMFQASGISGNSKPGVTPKHLSKIWRIDELAAERTIEVTSQLLKQEATDRMPRNF